MLIWTARFSRKKAVWIMLGVGAVMAALIMMAGRSSGQDPQALPQLLTNEDRVAYLETLGWEVETEPVETLRFLMPEELVEPYLTYNQLQLSQGFDWQPAAANRSLGIPTPSPTTLIAPPASKLTSMSAKTFRQPETSAVPATTAFRRLWCSRILGSDIMFGRSCSRACGCNQALRPPSRAADRWPCRWPR